MPLGTKHDLPHKSDSEDEDEDYVPPDAQASDSDTSVENTVGDGASVIPEETVDEETKKREREALWATFQASVANPPKPSETEKLPSKPVKIERRYRFAGEEVVEVVEVPEDSPEAKKWPLWKGPTADGQGNAPDDTQSGTASSSTASEPASASQSLLSITGTAEEGPKSLSHSSNPLAHTSSTSALPPETRPTTKRPGPRKPKTTLAPVPGPSKAKKLTTLDKSAMDWKKHLQEAGSSVTDELEANRRAGGYLEKVEFLKRVEERKEENVDALKGNKRRKL